MLTEDYQLITANELPSVNKFDEVKSALHSVNQWNAILKKILIV
ncbi:hypothetical protein [Shewanella sp. SNU WT4]|nr:hypothetical protein [Shewanella sp. SNU WT4]